MCGVGGWTGLGHISAELRYDLAEALGIGLDKRGGHAAGAVVVPEEGPPRLMRKLGTFGAARGRFIRAVSAGHSVMMHTRYATTGKRDEVENAHPFAVKRKTLDGEEKTVLYGCHNGMIHGAWDSAKKNGREYTVDSREFFELLADQAYETIRALSGYGVVTFIRPEDRAVRVLRLTRNSDFHAVNLVGGGVVWASTPEILKDALEYVKLTQDAVLSVSKAEDATIGRVFRLSGTEAVETKLDNIQLSATQTDRRTSGGVTAYNNYAAYQDYADDDNEWGARWAAHTSSQKWSDACWVCGNFSFHDTRCRYRHSVIGSESIEKNWDKWREAKASAKNDGAPKTSEKTISSNYVLCEDDTYRKVDSLGKVIPYAFPMYVKDKLDGEYRLAGSLTLACNISGKDLGIYPNAKQYPGLGQRRLTEDEVPKAAETQPSSSKETTMPAHNGHWMVPAGLTAEERKEWLDMYAATPKLAMRVADELKELREKTEAADLEDAAAELDEAFAQTMMKGD